MADEAKVNKGKTHSLDESREGNLKAIYKIMELEEGKPFSEKKFTEEEKRQLKSYGVW